MPLHLPLKKLTDSQYHLGPVLLEFGARNRGKPTDPCQITTYLSEVVEYEQALSLPVAESVLVFDPSYIIWEKRKRLILDIIPNFR